MNARDRALRARTWIAPGQPLELFSFVVDRIAAALNRTIELDADPSTSGPGSEADDVFARGDVDLGFLCTPSYLWLRGRSPPSVKLVPAAAVFADPRAQGRPVYFSELVVRKDHAGATLADLAGTRCGYNDTTSLTGYVGMLRAVQNLGDGPAFFGTMVCLGSHERVLEAVVAGDVDVASVDANVLARLRVERPALIAGIRVVETWGPFPAQPVVVRAELGELAGPVARILCALTDDPNARARLRAFGVHGFAPTTEQMYASLQATIDALAQGRRL